MRMTSCPVTATTFEQADITEAMQFATDYASANCMTQRPVVENTAYGNNLVRLPSFTGDLWVTTSYPGPLV